MTRVWLRWLPAAVVPAVIAAVAITVPLTASAEVNLPAKTPEQVLTMVGQSTGKSFSGMLEQTSQLGLPQLPTSGAGSNSAVSSALNLLTGSYTARVYLDGPTNARAQVMDKLAERDVVRRGNDVWLYSSSDNTATHVTLPAGTATHPTATPGDVQTPAQIAQRLLSAIDSTTRVTVGTNTRVAGRTAYDLVLSPRSTDTLIGSVSIAVDSQTGLPLSVDVQARGQDSPAFSLAFTALTLQTPAADLFQFVAPHGATVKEQALPQHSSKSSQPGTIGSHGDTAGSQHKVLGTGWNAVLQLPAGAVSTKVTSSPLFARATSSVAGGRLLHTALVNVLLTSDGRVFAGSVSLERLQAAATGS